MGASGAYVASHDHTLRVCANYVDQLARRVASAASDAAKAHGFAEHHG